MWQRSSQSIPTREPASFARHHGGPHWREAVLWHRLFGLGLDRRRHRSLGAGQQPISAEGVDLIPLELRVLLRRRQHDHPALGIDLLRQCVAFLRRMAEQLLQHRDHVLIGMVIVIPENHVVPRLFLGTGFGLRGLPGRDGGGGRSLLDGLHGGGGCGHGTGTLRRFPCPVDGATGTA